MKQLGLVMCLGAALAASSGCQRQATEPARPAQQESAAPAEQKTPALPPSSASRRESASTPVRRDSPPQGSATRKSGAAAATKEPAGKATAPAPTPRVVTLPAGTPLTVRVSTAISTREARSGDAFHASLAEALVVDGVTVAARGADVEGYIVDSDPGGRVQGVARLTVALRRLQTLAGEVEIHTGPHVAEARSTVRRDVARGALMSGIGAAVGAVAGGATGAAVGAGAGAAAGTATALATRGEPAVIPAETLLTFQLKEPLTVTWK